MRLSCVCRGPPSREVSWPAFLPPPPPCRSPSRDAFPWSGLYGGAFELPVTDGRSAPGCPALLWGGEGGASCLLCAHRCVERAREREKFPGLVALAAGRVCAVVPSSRRAAPRRVRVGLFLRRAPVPLFSNPLRFCWRKVSSPPGVERARVARGGGFAPFPSPAPPPLIVVRPPIACWRTKGQRGTYFGPGRGRLTPARRTLVGPVRSSAALRPRAPAISAFPCLPLCLSPRVPGRPFCLPAALLGSESRVGPVPTVLGAV